jgi:hypothetical protein
VTDEEQIQALYEEILLMTIEDKLIEQLEKMYPQSGITLEDVFNQD